MLRNRLSQIVALAAVLVLAILPADGNAQTRVQIRNAANSDILGVPGKPLIISCPDTTCAGSGTVTLNTSPFNVKGNATIAMTTSSQRVVLPTTDATVFVYNASTTSNAFIKLGSSSVVAAATDQVLPPGTMLAISNPATAAPDLAAILASGTGTLYISTGTGSPFAAGGAVAGSGGGGGAVTAVSGAFVDGAIATLGTLGGGACGTDNGSCTHNQGAWRIAQNHTTINGEWLAQGSTTSGQKGLLNLCPSTTSGAGAFTTGTTNPMLCDLFGHLGVVNYSAAGAPLDPAAPGNCGPTSTFVQCATKAGQPALDTANAPIVPQSGTATRTLTGTSLAATTNTTICPAATNPVATEIYFTTAGVGVGLNGQTLTTATPGATTTSSPDFVSTAGMYYLAPVGVSNAITAYGAAGVVRCIQTLRQ